MWCSTGFYSGSLLFLLYINDIHLSSSLLKFILFADATNVLFSNADFNMLQDILNSELEKVSNWLMANKLTVYKHKENQLCYFWGAPKTITLKYVLFNIRINNKTIECKSHTKFLGVYVDENLNWKEHVNLTANKVSKSIGIITKARFYLTMPSLRTLYFALVYPYLPYGTIVWGSTHKTTLNRLVVLRKCIIKVITKSCFDAPTAPLF